jgi:hypothetical protein
MKLTGLNFLRTAFVLPAFLISNAVSAQRPIPFIENFNGYISQQVPPGYSGDMKVYLNHGLEDGKAAAAWLTGANRSDSLSSPLIGPLGGVDYLQFSYRFVKDNIYPSIPAQLNNGDALSVMVSTDSVNWTELGRRDSSNHSPTLLFRRKGYSLDAFAGESVYFRFSAYRAIGSSEFFVDIDSIQISSLPPPVSVADLSLETPLVYFQSGGRFVLKASSNWKNGMFNLILPDGRMVVHHRKWLEEESELPCLMQAGYVIIQMFSAEGETISRKILCTWPSN